MFVLAFTLLAAPADVAAMVRHLEAVASAQSPAPSPDGARFAFVTTLFGSRQVASMAVDGSYPVQLTDEPDGVVSVRYSPADPRTLVAVALRHGKQRLVFLDEEGNPPRDVDAASDGDQLLAGFTRDGKKLIYASVASGKAELWQLPLDTKKPAKVAAPPPASGVPAPAVALEDALKGLVDVSPPSFDGRSVLAVVRNGERESVVLVDLATAKTETIVQGEGKARFRWPRFSHDGKQVYVLTNAGRASFGVDAITLQGHARKPIFTAKTNVEAYALSEDGHRLAVGVEQEGETLFSLLDYPSLRAQPLPQPPAGALAKDAAGEPPIVWNRQSDRLFFAWQLSDDTTDVWSFRMGYGTPQRHTRSPRPGIPRGSIPRPRLVKTTAPDGSQLSGWLWRPNDVDRPRVAVVASSSEIRPVFDKRIAALNFAGLAVLAFNGPGAQEAALAYVRAASDLDATRPILVLLDRVPIDAPSRWGGIVAPEAHYKGALELDEHDPDLEVLVKYATRGA